ncbi:NUDIX hydrolase [Roseovarius sp. SCSIO 43702]|uniref:NUDIX hydrolase n=1 Tax=Roseovarius sp. SCSIO 43702 TaxID=2823043 RepID=UPI001C73994A|nr:NUDIX hydrolase [Roseovarius sp. SCSIO 43702]QYX57917.1 NUDIX hydrolase [Roseovarius sp. SCSIO 43702]
MTAPTPPVDKTALRDAATVIVLRDAATEPRVLMGQRGSAAAFMPSKFVFPGGAVDAEDADVPLARPLPDLCAERLREDCARDLSRVLPVTAIRELWEETGLILGTPGTWPGTPAPDWRDYARRGHLPSAHALRFFFRAITPPGRPRRFDARFFVVDASEITGDLDDFSAASDELSHLQWVPLSRVREIDLPFITEVVLAELADYARNPAPPASVPFFRNDDEESLFLRLRGHAPGAAD